MHYENIFDRIVYQMRPVILALVYLALPVSLFSYGKMFVLAFTNWPWWASLAALIAHLIVLLGIGCLFDIQQERQTLREVDQDARPPHF